MTAPTLPPTAAEAAAVAAFEGEVRAAGEWRARLRNVLRSVTPYPAGVTAAPGATEPATGAGGWHGACNR